MANIILTQASSGAPTLSGANGTLCAVLDWALVQNGWAIEYTASNNRIYRPGTGKRFRLFVCHDSAVSGDARLATIRGCESASAASTAGIVDPFPTVAQVANNASSVLCSTATGATARDYVIVVGVDFVVMAINCGASTTLNWDMFAFGDWATDSWGCGIWVGGNTSVISSGSRAMNTVVASAPASSGKVFWCRSIDGSIKSAHGILAASSNSGLLIGLCAISSMPTMRSGYANRLVREKIAVSDNGSSTATIGSLAQHKRGWLPFVWAPLHSGIGSITSADTFTDTAYDAASSFQIVPASASVAAILELSDTWTVPGG